MFLGEGFEFTFLNLLMGVHTLLLGFILMIENLLKMFEDIFLFSLSLSELIRSLKNCPGLRSMFWVVSQKLLYFSKVETLAQRKEAICLAPHIQGLSRAGGSKGHMLFDLKPHLPPISHTTF